MIKTLLLLTVLALNSAVARSQVLITNTNVLDVDNRKMLAGYDVLALNGKIISIEKGRKYKLPAGTEVIDGSGKYLVPGFNDAHIHFFQSGSLFARPDAIDLRKFRPYATETKFAHDNMEDFLRRYMAAGITSVTDVGSTYNFLTQRDSFAGKNYAPVISMTGALLTTYIPPAFAGLGKDAPFIKMDSTEGVRRSVRELKAGGADFIKIWYIVLDADKEKGARKNLPLVEAIIDEAHKTGMRVAVHATERITAQLSAEAGADYLVHNVEDGPVSDVFVQLLKKNKTVLCPTMIVGGNYHSSFAHNYRFTTDELATANPLQVRSILDFPAPDTALGNGYIKSVTTPKSEAREAHNDSLLAANLKKLSDGGVLIAAGTDAGNIGTQHASSYFNELKAMQDAGLSTWDLLVSATINGAKAIGQEGNTGSVAKGKTASMVLLNANPLDNLTNWRNIFRVINRGVILLPDTLVKNSPEMLAQQQLNAYNAHDIEAFIAPYADSVVIYDLEGKVKISGKAEMRKQYAPLFKTPGLYCRLVNRIVQGNIVIDHEEISFAGSKKNFYGVAIYVIENGKIAKVYFPD